MERIRTFAHPWPFLRCLSEFHVSTQREKRHLRAQQIHQMT